MFNRIAHRRAPLAVAALIGTLAWGTPAVTASAHHVPCGKYKPHHTNCGKHKGATKGKHKGAGKGKKKGHKK
jgi:hypothetical protein